MNPQFITSIEDQHMQFNSSDKTMINGKKGNDKLIMKLSQIFDNVILQ